MGRIDNVWVAGTRDDASPFITARLGWGCRDPDNDECPSSRLGQVFGYLGFLGVDQPHGGHGLLRVEDQGARLRRPHHLDDDRGRANKNESVGSESAAGESVPGWRAVAAPRAASRPRAGGRR
jgi:hypothetical protein